MSLFDDVEYDSDDYHDEGETVERVTMDGPDPKWFAPDSEEEDNFMNNKIPRKLTMAQKSIDRQVMQSSPDWKQLKRTLEELERSMDRTLRRNTDAVSVVDHILDTVNTYMDSNKEESGSDSDEEGTKPAAKDSKLFKSLETLVTSLSNKLTQLTEGPADEKDDVVKEVSGEGQDDKEDPRKSFVRKLTAARKDSEFNELKKEAEMLRMPLAVVYIYTTAAQQVIQSSKRDRYMHSTKWTTAFDNIRRAVETMKVNNIKYSKSTMWRSTTADDNNEESRFVIDFTGVDITVPSSSIADVICDLFSEYVRTGQNQISKPGDSYKLLKMECSIVNFAYDLVSNTKVTAFKRFIPHLIDILSRRTPTLHKFLNSEFGEVKSDSECVPDVKGLWLMIAKSRSKETTRAFVNYCYHLAICGHHREAHNEIQREMVKSTYSLFGKTSTTNRTVAEGNHVSTKVAFNRLVAQLGMSYFRAGQQREAIDLLRLLCENMSWKVLIGQDKPYRRFESTEATARDRMYFSYISSVPHYNLPVERVETAYLILCAIESSVRDTVFGSGKYTDLLSSTLKRASNDVAGPPTSYTESIAALYRAISAGNASEALVHLASLPLWSFESPAVKELYVTRAKKAALQCFIYTGGMFQSITVSYLVERFDLDEVTVRATVNAVLLNPLSKALTAFWEDDCEEAIVIEHCSASTLQKTQFQTAKNLLTSS